MTGGLVLFRRRPLVEGLVIARFEVEERKLAVERTSEPSEYLLAVDRRTVADIIALMTVSPAGEVVDHKAECRYATEAEVADWVRRSGWKILTYLQRRPSKAGDNGARRRDTVTSAPASMMKESH